MYENANYALYVKPNKNKLKLLKFLKLGVIPCVLDRGWASLSVWVEEGSSELGAARSHFKNQQLLTLSIVLRRLAAGSFRWGFLLRFGLYCWISVGNQFTGPSANIHPAPHTPAPARQSPSVHAHAYSQTKLGAEVWRLTGGAAPLILLPRDEKPCAGNQCLI